MEKERRMDYVQKYTMYRWYTWGYGRYQRLLGIYGILLDGVSTYGSILHIGGNLKVF